MVKEKSLLPKEIDLTKLSEEVTKREMLKEELPKEIKETPKVKEEPKEIKKEKKSKEIPLEPMAISKGSKMTKEEIEDLKKAFSSNRGVEIASNDLDLNSLFNNAVNQLYSPDNIDMKTEYNDEDAIFASSSGEFIGRACNVPLIPAFLTKYERKMVSKGRKGRADIILTMQRRQEAEDAQALKNAFNGARM